MASNQAIYTPQLIPYIPVTAARTVEVVFAGDGVRLAGQIDYPPALAVGERPPASGYPLLFIVPHADCKARDAYDDYAAIGLERGYAVFRWDKRGTGQSGSSGSGSAVQDAVNAYEIALEQEDVNRQRAVILAVGAGTALLGSSFGLFARGQEPYGALLIANMLDPQAVLAINTRLKIIMGADDWNPAVEFAEAACIAHQKAYTHGAGFYIAPNADRMLETTKDGVTHLNAGARKVISGWLHNILRPSTFS
jgi:hypothetical protein